MKFEDFRREIILSLGGGLVDVEFDPVEYACSEPDIDFDPDESIMLAFRRAKREFISKGNDNYDRGFVRLSIEKGKTVYDLPSPDDGVGGRVDTVLRIIRPKTSYVSDTPFGQLAYDQIFSGVGGMGTDPQFMGGPSQFLNYELTMQTLDKIKRYTAYYVDFHHNKPRNTLEIYHNPKRAEEWIVECYKELSDEEYMDVLWVQKWALAEAMKMLGVAYRKFQTVAGPNGETTLDGSSLIQEANEMMRELVEDRNNGIDGDVDWYDIYVG